MKTKHCESKTTVLVLDKPTYFQFAGNNRHLNLLFPLENEHEFEQRNELSITINAIVFQVGLDLLLVQCSILKWCLLV